MRRHLGFALGIKWQFQSTPRREVLTLPVDVRIRTYILEGDAELVPLDDVPFEEYGTCPNVGDTICINRGKGRQAYSVVRRYYLSMPGWGWAIDALHHRGRQWRCASVHDTSLTRPRIVQRNHIGVPNSATRMTARTTR